MVGLKIGREERSTTLPVFVGSAMTTAFVSDRLLLIPIFPIRSSACLRSASCSLCRNLARRAAGCSSSLLDSSSSSDFFRKFASLFSSILCDFDFLFAAAAASALALVSAAFLAFSASTSESSAASQSSTT